MTSRTDNPFTINRIIKQLAEAAKLRNSVVRQLTGHSMRVGARARHDDKRKWDFAGHAGRRVAINEYCRKIRSERDNVQNLSHFQV